MQEQLSDGNRQDGWLDNAQLQEQLGDGNRQDGWTTHSCRSNSGTAMGLKEDDEFQTAYDCICALMDAEAMYVQDPLRGSGIGKGASGKDDSGKDNTRTAGRS